MNRAAAAPPGAGRRGGQPPPDLNPRDHVTYVISEEVGWNARFTIGVTSLKLTFASTLGSTRVPASKIGELNGAPIQAENNTSMPAAFLMQQMQWREALEEADTAAEVETLSDEVQLDRKARIARVTRLLDVDANPTQAAQEVRALMFIDRLLEEIDARLERYEDAI